jgi:hypothetical protein
MNSASLRLRVRIFFFFQKKKAPADSREGFGLGVVPELLVWYTGTESVVKLIIPVTKEYFF